MNEPTDKEKKRLVGLHLGFKGDTCHDNEWINYDIGEIAEHALTALQTAVLAVEQIVTGEKLVNSLDVGDFYHFLSEALAVENGEGVQSEAGSMPSIQDEIQSLSDLVACARRIARRPRGE